jgi:hypothetical protein
MSEGEGIVTVDRFGGQIEIDLRDPKDAEVIVMPDIVTILLGLEGQKVCVAIELIP